MQPYDEDRDEVIQRAIENGVTKLITIGIDIKSSEAAIALAQRYDSVHATIGVHPHNVTEMTDDEYKILREMGKDPNVVAYGEIGMDMVKTHAPADLQEEHFRKQLQLAKELNLPVIIHDREAHDTIMKALQDLAPFPAGGVMHCFSGNADLAREVIKLGFCISIPGVVTFNKAEQLQDAVRKTPLTSIILETDAPYLAPVPKRGKRNEPAYTLYTAAKVAELKNVSIEEVAEQTTANVVKLFHI